MPSSSIGGISWGSGRGTKLRSSRFGFLLGRSLSGAASIRDLFKDDLDANGSGKSAKLSLGGSSPDCWSLGNCFAGLTLGNVVNRAECGMGDVGGACENVL